MAETGVRTTMRRICYAALPISAVLIVPSFSLMPNRMHGVAILDAELKFQIGFVMALTGVVLAAIAMLVLVLEAETEE